MSARPPPRALHQLVYLVALLYTIRVGINYITLIPHTNPQLEKPGELFKQGNRQIVNNVYTTIYLYRPIYILPTRNRTLEATSFIKLLVN